MGPAKSLLLFDAHATLKNHSTPSLGTHFANIFDG